MSTKENNRLPQVEENESNLMPNWQDENEVRRAFIASEVFKRKY